MNRLPIVAGIWIFLIIWAQPSRAADFALNVASGDCTSDSAVVWTRAEHEGSFMLEVAKDDQFTELVLSKPLTANAEQDFTLKQVLTGLTPAMQHFFRFIDLSDAEASPIGQFKTAPADEQPASFRFIYTGDSNAGYQPFWLFDHALAEQPDFWFWAGDTIYADNDFDLSPIATDLPGYRSKYVQNHNDPHLQQFLQTCPVWAQWDDHEVANDYDGGDLEPGISREQQSAAYQAFFEYTPVGDQGAADDPRRIYRSFRYGSLAEFFILDCRQYRSADAGREGGGPDPRAFLLPTWDPAAIQRMEDPARTMLGAAQLKWLENGLAGSSAKWKFVLSSVPLTSLLYYPYDRWDGYDAERYAILKYIDDAKVSGVVFLSADIHGNTYNPDLTYFLRNSLGKSFSPNFAVPEFIAGPIGTATFEDELGGLAGAALGQSTNEVESGLLFQLGLSVVISQVTDRNKLTFVEPNRFAYILIDVNPDTVTFTHKGITPSSAMSLPSLETLHTVMLPAAPVDPGCAAGLPFSLGMLGFMLISGRARRQLGRTASSPFRDSRNGS